MSYNWKVWAQWPKIVVDIDPLELRKPTVKPDLPVHADVGDVIRSLIKKLPNSGLDPEKEWLTWCKDKKDRYPVVIQGVLGTKRTGEPLLFRSALSKFLPEGQIHCHRERFSVRVYLSGSFYKKGSDSLQQLRLRLHGV